MSEEKVTLRDIYAAVNRLEDKFDRRIVVLEKDVNELQKFQNKALGIVSVLAVFTSLVANAIWQSITGQRS